MCKTSSVKYDAERVYHFNLETIEEVSGGTIAALPEGIGQKRREFGAEN